MVCVLKTLRQELILDQIGAERFGIRTGNKSTHTSRTMMLADLEHLFDAVPAEARRPDYQSAIVDLNCLGKDTVATRRLAFQRLSELYALDPSIPLFRVLRRLWPLDRDGRPLVAVLAAIARDPLLATTADTVLSLRPDGSLSRDDLTEVVRAAVGDRLNPATVDKVVRNVASTWEQSGHLEGRTFKRRRLVRATVPGFTFALFLGYAAGFRGAELLSSPWIRILDLSAGEANLLAQEAKRIGLIDYRAAGDVVAISLERLDPSLRDARR